MKPIDGADLQVLSMTLGMLLNIVSRLPIVYDLYKEKMTRGNGFVE